MCPLHTHRCPADVYRIAKAHTQRHRHQYPYICIRSDDHARPFMPHKAAETCGSARQKPASPPWISCHPQIRALISVLCPQPTAFALPSGRRRHLSLARTQESLCTRRWPWPPPAVHTSEVRQQPLVRLGPLQRRPSISRTVTLLRLRLPAQPWISICVQGRRGSPAPRFLAQKEGPGTDHQASSFHSPSHRGGYCIEL